MDQRLVGTRRLMMLTPTHLTGNQSEVCPCPFLEAITVTPHYPLQMRAHILEGISPLRPLLPGKTIKLFFSTSLQTLSLRFDSAAVYREANLSVTVPRYYYPFLQSTPVARCRCLKMIRKCLLSTTSYPSEQPSLQSLQITSAGEGVEKKRTLLHY